MPLRRLALVKLLLSLLTTERRNGQVVRALGCGVECHRFECRSGQILENSLSTQQQMGT